MIGIDSAYLFFGRDQYMGFEIHTVMADGTFVADLVEWDKTRHVIHGTFDAATNKVQFSEGGSPGDTLLTTFFTGYAIVTGGHTKSPSLAGTWSEQRLSFGPGRTFNGVVYDNGGWYALWEA